MSGLDKMKARILEEADHSAQEIIAKAESEAQSALQTAEQAAAVEAEKIIGRAEKNAEDYAKRVESSVEMHRKQARLAAKQEVIGNVLTDAYESVMSLGTEEYFEMLGRMLEKNVLSGEGVICFSVKDLERMPDDFREKINTTAASAGGTLKISDEAYNIDGGFLLIYGGVEENCTIKAVFDAKKEELSDQVNRLLFG